MNKQELINKLPTEWSQVTLNQYINLIKDLKIVDNADKNYLNQMVAIWFYNFTGVYMDEANLNATDTMLVIEKMNAFSERADKPKVDLTGRIKTPDELTYAEFITLIRFQENNSIDVYPQMINIMLKEPIDNIGDNMDMATADSFFLQLRNHLTEYLECTQSYLMEQIQKQVKVEQ